MKTLHENRDVSSSRASNVWSVPAESTRELAWSPIVGACTRDGKQSAAGPTTSPTHAWATAETSHPNWAIQTSHARPGASTCCNTYCYPPTCTPTGCPGWPSSCTGSSGTGKWVKPCNRQQARQKLTDLFQIVCFHLELWHITHVQIVRQYVRSMFHDIESKRET